MIKKTQVLLGFCILLADINKKKEATKNVAPMIRHIPTDINKNNNNIYLNISFLHYHAGLAPVASMVRHSSHKRGPNRHPGSIPGWGDPAPNFSLARPRQDEFFLIKLNKRGC